MWQDLLEAHAQVELLRRVSLKGGKSRAWIVANFCPFKASSNHHQQQQPALSAAPGAGWMDGWPPGL